MSQLPDDESSQEQNIQDSSVNDSQIQQGQTRDGIIIHVQGSANHFVVSNSLSNPPNPPDQPPSPPPRITVVATLILSFLVTVLVMGVRYVGWLQGLELQAFDYLMRQRPPESPDSRLLIVKITDEEVSNYGGYPLADITVARLIERLEQYKPMLIGLYMHRYNSQKQGRSELMNRFKENKNLVTVCSYNYSSTSKDLNPPPKFSKEQLEQQVGFSDLVDDKNSNRTGSFIRRQLLSYNSNSFPSSSASHLCNTPLSFSLRLAYNFLYFKDIKPLESKNDEFVLGKAIFHKLASRTGGYQNLDGKYNEILLNYRSGEPAETITLSQVLNDPLNKNLVKDRVVLIGYANKDLTEESIDGADDGAYTLYGRMPAIFIHAHMVSQILSAATGERPLLWVLPHWYNIQWGDGIFIFICSLTGGVLALRFRSFVHLLLVGGVPVFVLYQICLVILTYQGGWMPLIPSTMCLITTGMCVYITTQFRYQ